MAAPGRARLVALVGVVALLSGLSGACGDSDGPDASPTASASSSTSAPTTEATPTQSTATESAPTVAPADGKPIVLPTLTGAFPAGWTLIERNSGSTSAGDTDVTTGGLVYVSDLKNFGSEDFDEKVAIVMDYYADDKTKPKRTENRVVDGVEGWVVQGASDMDQFVYEFGTFLHGRDIRFTFSFRKAPKDPMETVDSVLASIHWR
jgi:hypothetical protein